MVSRTPHDLMQLLTGIPTRQLTANNPEMDEEEVLRVLQLAGIASIPLVVDGGWAVDACLGWQTRPHADLDLAINHQYLPRFLEILNRIGYQHVHTGDEWLHNFVLEDGAGHRVDIHSFVRNEKGRVIGGVQYPGESLTGQGKIAHLKVACITPEWQIDFHTGYDFDHDDYQDVRYLCNLYRLEPPIEYREYEDSLYLEGRKSGRITPEDFSVEAITGGADYDEFLTCLSGEERRPEEVGGRQVRVNQALLFDQAFPQGSPDPQQLISANFRVGLLLKRGREIAGCIEIAPRAGGAEDPGGLPANAWVIRQLNLGKYKLYSRVFGLLVGQAVTYAFEHNIREVAVRPLDDINRPREVIAPSYDEASIGYATKYIMLGFEHGGVESSEWIKRAAE